ncbi:MAG: tetratricopeptide repeat protein [Planctomycetota bacterium]|jgi:tetratricopeptide (TPR) repeat protein
MLLTWLLKTFFTAYGNRIKKTHLTIVLTTAIMILTAQTILLRRYITCWKDTITLYKHTLTKYPNDLKSNDNLGATLGQQGRHDEAMPYLLKAVEIAPKNPDARSNLALTLAQTGQPKPQIRNNALALSLAKKACRISEYKNTHMLRILAWAYSENGDSENAIKICKKNIDLLLAAGKINQANELAAQLRLFQSTKP